MILLDPPIDYPGFKGCSHMCSNLHGAAGTAELITFARKIGMKIQWLQKRGTEHEHFDVFGWRRKVAVGAGAKEVSRAEIGAVWKAKREVLRNAQR